jgi:hypothetical protein
MAADPAEEMEEGEAAKRERSTIEFPYMDLDDAHKVALAIYNSTAHATCQSDMLAQRLELSMNSSGFRSRISTAKMFGLIETDRNGHGYRLTPLGQNIVDPKTQRAAMVAAFFAVPLYKKIHEQYRGRALPPAAALEREMSTIGVSPKQTDRARQTLERSAATAGFFAEGRDRLIMPHIGPNPPAGAKDDENSGGGGGGDGGNGGGHDGLDVVIAALIQKLPKGDTFDSSARVRWLRQIEMAFQDAYGDGNGEIEIKLKSKADGA